DSISRDGSGTVPNKTRPESILRNTNTISTDSNIVTEPNVTSNTTQAITQDPIKICYDRFEKPHKKLDGALAILYDLNNIKNFRDIEEEILSRTLPKQWRKIKLGCICYQVSNTTKADHYDLKSDEAISAFISEVKYKKSLQLCVYQENEFTRANKRIRTLETESDTINTLNSIKKKIYENLPSCDIHIQGCLISGDGRHLKLDGDLITLWARAILTKMQGVDEQTPPNIPSFDKSKYRYPVSRRSSDEANMLPLRSITLNTKKKSPLKSNVHITKNMTFQDLLNYVFPNGPPTGKRDLPHL
ncbi:4875_t:CDS:2, partial [Cetraspora pellucida]